MENLRVQSNNYTIRREMHQGRAHIVVPVIMMIDGVHSGSAGPLLHTAEEFGKIPGSWNGIPVVVRHPEDAGGRIVSANSPDVIDFEKVGAIYNTVCNGKLKAEAWIDEERIKQVSPDALAYINQQRPLEVSVGVFTEDEAIPGNWNGENYTAIARNHRPDHLALLPGETGACSWADGCGIRANKDKGDKDVKDLFKTMKELSKKGYSVVQINETGAREIGRKIQSKLDAMDTDLKFHFLEDFFPDTNDFVYKVNIEGSSKLFRRDFQVNADDSLEFLGEPVEVIKKTSFDPIQTNSTNKGGVKTMAEKKVKTCCPEKVNLIIQSKHTRFEETDREYLETLEEGNIVKLLPIEPEPAKSPQVNKEQAVEVLKEQLKTPEQFMQLLSGETKAQMEHGLSLYREERNKLEAHLVANSEFTAEDLKPKSIIELKKMASLIKAPADFSGNGAGGGTFHDNSQPKLVVMPMGVTPGADN